ncbi:MAG: hypothetical protein VYB46_08620 [Pseudomonadota bacterium]|nr:hypothetical protein [Pseudomonadota bacterium]
MKLTHFDRSLIHVLGVLSRPPLVADTEEHRMLVDIAAKAAERATQDGAMLPLIKAAALVHPVDRHHRAIAHHVAAAMNDFDRWALGAHWDAARGVK